MRSPVHSFPELQAALLGRMSSLDGMRGLAVLLVIWHNGLSTGTWVADSLIAKLVSVSAAFGWVGVQLFFVLSGFLITGILLKEKGTQHQFRNFYARRMLRIFPLYYLMLIAVFIALPAMGVGLSGAAQSHHGDIWYWFFLENWTIPVLGGNGGLSHFWSVAVEEQFYLLWPLAVVFLTRRPLIILCAFLVVSALIARIVLITTYPDIAQWAAYEFTFVRWDALAIGAILAFAVRDEAALGRLNQMTPAVAALLMLYMLVYAVLFHNFAAVETVASVLNQTVIAVLAALLLFRGIYSENKGAALHYILNNRALKDAGKYSYAMYVFHFPVVLAIGSITNRCCASLQQSHSWTVAVLRVCLAGVISYLMARLSWSYIESPLLQLKKYFYQPENKSVA